MIKILFDIQLKITFSMASNLLKFHIHSTYISPPFTPSKIFRFSRSAVLSYHPFSNHSKNPLLTTLLPNRYRNIPKIKLFKIHSSTSSSPTPPYTKEDAINQAKLSLSTVLQKTLNSPKLTGKIKKQKQPRFRLEVPIIDDSPESLAQLAHEIFGNIQLKRKGPVVKIVLIWPNPTTLSNGIKAFQGLSSNVIEHVELTTIMTVDNRILNSADVAIFLAPNSSQLNIMKLVSESLFPTPLVLFNPKWAFEEEEGFGDLRNFVGSFDVVYAFLGLEVRGLLSKQNGVVFKFVRDGVVSGEKWNVFVEEEERGNQLKVVSRFDNRPSMAEVENVLYNLVAINSPITKATKFLKGLVSNVTGKKQS